MPADRDTLPLTGDELINELLHNMEQGLFPLRYSILVPCSFQVYLHQQDYDALRPVLPHMVAEARQALEEKLLEWNKARPGMGLLAKLGAGNPAPREHKRLSEWRILLLPDHEGKLALGDIEIYSELAEEQRPEYGAGQATRRIIRATERTPATDTSTRDSAIEAEAPDSQETVRQPSAMAAGPVYAWLRYTDEEGDKNFAISKPDLVIGRGGKTAFVDVKIVGVLDVSRKHCRLRRDARTGQFFIKDVSQFGTSVDGKRLPQSLVVNNGVEQELDQEALLPRQARIGLADRVFLQFEQAE